MWFELALGPAASIRPKLNLGEVVASIRPKLNLGEVVPLEQWRAGLRSVVFPQGTWCICRAHGAAVQT
jgi:hypothetical protein